MEAVFGANGAFTNFKARVRNPRIFEWEATIFFASAFLILESFVMLWIGMDMTGGELINKLDIGFERLVNLASAYVIFMFLLLLVVSVLGIKLVVDRTSPSCCVIIYATILLFFLVIPLMSEGLMFIGINFIEPKLVDDLCAM